MAIFNEDQGPVAADYTSDSKGFKANTAYADLFGAAGELGVTAVKIADQNNLQNIRQGAQEGIDAANAEWGTNAPEGTGFPQPLPADIQKYAKNLGDTRKAFLNGALKESNYQMRIESMSKQLRSRYPGYRHEIDAIISDKLGQSTANDLRRSLLREWSAEQESATEAEKDYREFVERASFDGSLPADYWQRIAQNRPYPEAAVRAHVAAVNGQNAEIARQKSMYDLEAAASDSGKRKLEGIAQSDIAMIQQKTFDGVFKLAGGDTTMKGLLEKVQQGLVKPWNPQQTAELTAAFAQMSTNLETQLWAKMSAPFYNGLSPDQKKKLVDQGMAQMKVISDAVTNQQWGLLNASKTLNETAVQNTLQNWRIANPAVSQIEAASKLAGGSDALNFLLMNNPKMQSLASDAVTALLTGQVVDPGAGVMKDIIKDGNAKEGGQLDPAVIKQTLKNSVTLLLKKDATFEVAAEQARKLFSEENQDFLNDYTDKSQTQLFDTLVSPRMTERIMELSKSDPQIGVNYRNWVLNSFNALFNQDVANINDVNQFGDSLQIKWDAAKGQFKEEANPQAVQRAGLRANMPGGTLADVYDKWANSEARASMNKLNKYVAQLKPILENEGGTAEEALTALFESAGVNRTTNQGSFFFRLYQAMATGSPATQGQMDRKKAYEGAINAPTQELQGIDLDKTGSGQMKSGSKLKDIIRKAEGTTGSYNTRYGGATDIELSLYDVGDVRDMAKIFGKKSGSSAIGAYQFMPETIDRLIKLGVISDTDRFTPELQEKMADYLIAEAGQGAKGREGFAKNIAKVWAGLPQGPDNSSYYGGVGLNPKNAQITWDEYMSAF